MQQANVHVCKDLGTLGELCGQVFAETNR